MSSNTDGRGSKRPSSSSVKTIQVAVLQGGVEAANSAQISAD